MSGWFGGRLTHRTTQSRKGTTSPLTDASLTAASEDELRRRAAEGNQNALAELARRRRPLKPEPLAA